MAKSMALGGGGRFAAFKSKVSKEPGYNEEEAAAVAASAGRKKYGKKKFQSMAAAGRHRSALSKAISKRRGSY